MKKSFLLMMLSLFTMVLSCSSNSKVEHDYLTVNFDTCINLETNYIEEQHLQAGDKVVEPAVVLINDQDYDKKIGGWYLENSYKTKWNFDTDLVSGDMTLFAKWVDIISINYYLKGSSSPIWIVNNASSGEPLERHDELCDGYEFYGYFVDSACTIPFDLNKPLEEDTTVYLYRGDTLSLNPHSIKRRFVMHEAGGSGSTAGFISDVGVDENGEEYVDVNFGYSTSGDPYMIISNPQIDISKSQKIKIKYKNFGGASSVSFYWVSKYADGNYASGYQYDTEANAAHYMTGSYECYMEETDPWIVREFDLGNKFSNGVSPWANSITLVHLRIQFSYISRSVTDLSNVVRFSYITGISDDTNVGFKDSEPIKNMLSDDSEVELNNASSSQEQNRGVIFPKNNDKILSTSTGYYKKKNGLLMYSPYGSDIRRYFFDVSDQNIDASIYSYVTIKFRNYSYIPNFTFYVVTSSPSGASLNTTSNVMMPIRMKSFDDATINFYGKVNMVGNIKSFSILFNYNGVDNAILLESITMSENKSYQVPGINFNDVNYAGFTPNSDLVLSYNKTDSATNFEILNESALATFDYGYTFDITAHNGLVLNYYLYNAGVTSIKVRVKINNEWKLYVFDDLSISTKKQKKELPLEETGLLQSIEIGFTGTGTIIISSLEFSLDPKVSCDFSDQATFNAMLSDWSSAITYIEDKKAVLYKNPVEPIRYYFGYLYQYDKREYPNIPLYGKSNIYLIYQNQKSYGSPYINVYATSSLDSADYLVAFNENRLIVQNYEINIDKNMDENSWKVIAIPIPSIYTSTEEYYLSNFFISSAGSAAISMYIRGIVVL